MDRQTIYFGQIPLETDLLHAEQNAVVALAKLAAGVFGTSPVVNGFTCTPTAPASLSVLLTAGEIYQVANLEATAWSSLPADTAHSILKQGILLDPLTFAITPPGTTGFSQVFLIEVQYADSDTGSTVLSYYNSAQPSNPFNGPGNAGTAQNTVRKGIVATQVKAGVAAATGTQVAPTADAGWTGLFTITVANGQSTITTGNIAQLSNAPFIPTTLPAIPSNLQNGSWISADDTGTANAIVITPQPAITAYVKYQRFQIKLANNITGASTINVNGLGAKALTRADLTATKSGDGLANEILTVIYDGTEFQISGVLTSSQPPQNVLVVTAVGNGTWTVPPGVTKADVEVWGGGGGSGGATPGANGSGGAGGAGGGYSRKLITGLVPGTVINFTVGAGGTAGAIGTGNGGNGGTTSFGSYHSATGGNGGLANSTNGSTGGAGIGGDINISGQTGNGMSIISANAIMGGGGGNAPLGAQGTQFGITVTNGAFNGVAGAAPGGGSTGGASTSGSTANVTGAAGGAGQIAIRW